MVEYTNMQYNTPIYLTEEEAWIDLGWWLEKNIPERHMLLFRDKPAVENQLNFDTKQTEFRGYVRFCFDPNAQESLNSMQIPSLGSA